MHNWTEGENGKGIVDDNQVHTWNEDEFPLHRDFLKQYPDIQPSAYFYIEPDGRIDVTHPSRLIHSEDHGNALRNILDLDPQFYEGKTDWDW